jgi:hypothetical protein
MSLASPALNNTAIRRKVTKVTKSQQEELERGWRARNIWLRDLGLPKESLEQYTEWVYGRGKKTKAKTQNRSEAKTTARIQNKAPQVNPIFAQNTSLSSSAPSKWVTGPCTTKPSPTYTGTKIIGIGTLHKSNAVPVFSNEEAIDIARMRR